MCGVEWLAGYTFPCFPSVPVLVFFLIVAAKGVVNRLFSWMFLHRHLRAVWGFDVSKLASGGVFQFTVLSHREGFQGFQEN